jgi:tRNA threonylcarbamoyladenosine modification (KEOPS) complex  Pcc1 subunit
LQAKRTVSSPCVATSLSSKVTAATLKIELSGSKKLISALADSLSPETISGKRLTFTVSKKNEGETLLLHFVASDVVSLRAGMNTILRLTLSALNSIEAVKRS